VDGSYQSLEALPIEHLHIVFVASSSCSEDDIAIAAPPFSTAAGGAPACQQRPTAKRNSGFANGYAKPDPPRAQDVRPKAKKSPGKTAAVKRATAKDRDCTSSVRRKTRRTMSKKRMLGVTLKRVSSWR